ncbi:MAG: lamin tail domain-containing protein [Bacteroidota bacterium]
MKKTLLSIFAIVMFFGASAQFEDNFGDGNFTDDPTWLGDTGVFIINATNELQLNDVAGGVSFLYSAVPHADSTVWDFYVRLEFAPSTSNFARVYLSSDQADLDGDLNGYFLKIGGESGSTDKLELFRQDGSSTTSLLTGTEGGVGNDPAEARVRLTRDNNGNWELLADYSGGNTLTSEGTVFDDTYPSGEYFGFHCTYTTTRADKFFFDDVIVSPVFMDMEPPVFSFVEAASSTEIDITFDEEVDISSAQISANYAIDGGLNITSATLDGGDPTLVHLVISPPMTSGQTYTISASEVEDLNGNAIPGANPQQSTFTFFDILEPSEFDILINEMLPDDNPSIGLPEAEFIELYNNSNFAFELANFTIERVNLSSGSMKVSTLPAKLMLPQTHVILCTSTNAVLFESFADAENILGLSNFSSFLPNTDDALFSLKKADGTVIHEVNYSASLFAGMDPNGLTLELVNPEAACLGAENWRPSVDQDGGTPGAENSVLDPGFGNIPPALTGVLQLSDTEILLLFDKSLEANLAEDPDQYILSGGPSALSPDMANYDPVENTVLLTFVNAFIDGTDYTIMILPAVQDCLGNAVSDPDSGEFTYVETLPADRYDIIINEIYPDPTPSNGLPEKEFVELFNRSDKNINLKDFILSDRSGLVSLPDFILEPGAFVILYEAGNPGYGIYGDTIALEDFIGLGNESDDLTLISNQGTVIDAVFYDMSWYQNTSKDDGGWTIERVNPNKPCDDQTNWRAALDLPGGTPGTVNSIIETDADVTFPDLIKAFPVSDFEVRLTFSEAMSSADASDVNNYSFSGDLGTADFAFLEPPSYNSVLISLNNPIIIGTIYEVTVNGINDCVGNEVGVMNTARFAAAEQVEPGDLIINEVLFNPYVGGSDFVEIVNVSEKVINLNGLIMANRDDAGNINQTAPVEGDCLLFPGEYMVFTPDPVNIKTLYATTNPNGFLETGLPTYSDAEGDVVLARPALIGSEVIDEFSYLDDYHYELLDFDDGVSLERIRFDGESQDPANWHSAAEDVGFATPAYENSQFFGNLNPIASLFEIPDPSFSPDNDGFKDFLLLQYDLDQPGYLANIWIYDAKGRKVHTLARNELLGTTGTKQWDGVTDEGTKARLGIYVMFIEVFDLNGNVSRFKETFVVGGKL